MAGPQRPEELVRTVEAVLFSYGKRVHIDEISRLCRLRNSPETVIEALGLLKQEYDEKQNALMVVQDGDHWKLTTRERFSHVVSKIVPHTELSKTIMETLAIIAWKAPMRQSELIEIRTNKAYDHVTELVDSGFISKEKYGRTYLLKLTQKFFDYFDLKNVDEAHKMFDKILPEQEKKIMEEKILAAKEAVDARESAEADADLPHVPAQKAVTKATLASDLISAAKGLKIQRQENSPVVETKEEVQSGEPQEIKQTDDSVSEDLEDEVIEEDLEKMEEDLPGTELSDKSRKRNEDDLAKPEED